MFRIVCTTLLSSSLLLAPAVLRGAEEPQDLLDIAAGAVVLSTTGEYREDWSTLLLLDGSTERGWCSPSGAPTPHSFVIELAGKARLERFVVDNTGTEESSYPGISAKAIEIWVSTEGPDAGYRKVMTFEAAQGERREAALPAGTEARWLKLVVASNHGREDFTEMMELEAYGTLLETTTDEEVAGIYRTNYNLMRLERRGNELLGCYDWDGGTLRGSTDGRVIRFAWREDGDQHGTAVMVLSGSTGALNGIWFEEGRYRGLWFGPRAKPGDEPQCKVAQGSALEAELERSGRAIVYGIYFDSGSDRLRPDSDAALQQILEVLQAKGELRLRIEGHTDAQASEAHNLSLSRRRAAAVKSWLVAREIPAERLQTEGFGEARPVADNDSPQGRALNRRVEVVALGDS